MYKKWSLELWFLISTVEVECVCVCVCLWFSAVLMSSRCISLATAVLNTDWLRHCFMEQDAQQCGQHICVCVSVCEKVSLPLCVCETRMSCERPICPGVCPPVILPAQALQRTPKLSVTRTPRVQSATQHKQHWHCSCIWQPESVILWFAVSFYLFIIIQFF